MLKCREFVDAADELLDGSLTRRQRLSMYFHMFICRHCWRYLVQLRALLRGIAGRHKPASDEDVARVMRCIHDHQHEQEHGSHDDPQ